MRGSSTLAPASSGVDGYHVEVLHGAGGGRGVEGEVAGEAVVHVGGAVLRQPERDGGVALRIQVHEQRGVAAVGDAGGRG